MSTQMHLLVNKRINRIIDSFFWSKHFALVAQWIERLFPKHKAEGSTPS